MVNSYFDYIENEKGGLDDIKLLNKFLAENMKDDVTLYLTHRVILSCKIFRGTEAGFLRSVMLVLVQHFYTRDEEVVVQGEPADGMSFIAAGDVDILLDGEQVNSLSVNASFAEAAVLSVVDSFAYTARCTSYNEQWFLSRTGFRRLLPEFPLVRAKLGDMTKRVRSYKAKNGNRQTRQTTAPEAGKDSSQGMAPGRARSRSRQAAAPLRVSSTFCRSRSNVALSHWTSSLRPWRFGPGGCCSIVEYASSCGWLWLESCHRAQRWGRGRAGLVRRIAALSLARAGLVRRNVLR